MSGLGDYYDMYSCKDCDRRPNEVRVFLVPVSKEDYGTHPSNRHLSLEERIPKCPIHKIRMSPVAWEINREGETTSTDYLCDKCGKERKPRKPGDPPPHRPSHFRSNNPYYRPGVIGANGERVPY